MGYSEKTIVRQVTLMPDAGVIMVQWSNQVLRDDEVISEQFHRKGYMPLQRDEFIEEVENGAAYIAAFGW